jgi:hypothetical protein
VEIDENNLIGRRQGQDEGSQQGGKEEGGACDNMHDERGNNPAARKVKPAQVSGTENYVRRNVRFIQLA